MAMNPRSYAFVVCLVAVMIFAAVSTVKVMRPSAESGGINELINLRERAYGSLPSTGKRIIFAGGSGTLFGVRARDIQAGTGVTAFNMGLHAGLGAFDPLQRALRLARKGDVVVWSV